MIQVHRTEHYKDFAEFTRPLLASEHAGMISVTLYESDLERQEQLEYLEGFWEHICQVKTVRVEVDSGDGEQLVSRIEELLRNGIRVISVLRIPLLPDAEFVELVCGLNTRRERLRRDGLILLLWLTPTRLREFIQHAPDLISIARIYAVSDEKYTISLDLVGDQIKDLEEKYKISTLEFVRRWATRDLSELNISDEDERLWVMLAEAVRDYYDGAG